MKSLRNKCTRHGIHSSTGDKDTLVTELMKLEADHGASHVERFDPEIMECVQIPIAVAPKMQRRAGQFTHRDDAMHQRTPEQHPR